MAILMLESFDHYGSGTVITSPFLGKWISGVGSPTTSSTLARTGTYSMRFTTGVNITSKVFTTSGGAIVGAAWNSPSFGNLDIIQIIEASTVHVALAVTAGGLLVVKRGTTVLATGTTVLPFNNWNYIELKAIISDTGSYEVRIDGVTEAALTNTGPVDTQNGGTGVWDRIVLASASTSFNYAEDVYISDTSGSAPRNTFLGPIKVETLMPQTDAVDAGSNAGLTPSTGTDHGALVDETTPNTTDYNGSATVGVKDTYEYPAMTLTGTVYGVQTNLYCAKSDASARTVCPVVRTASTDTDGTAVSPTTTFSYQSQVWQQDPNAGSPIEWTTANIATMQAGMKVVS